MRMKDNITAASIRALNRLQIGNTPQDELKIFWFRAVSHRINHYMISPRSHHHTFYELHFILGGSVDYRFEERTVSLTVGEYLIISPLQDHKVENISEDFVKLSVAFSLQDGSPIQHAMASSRVVSRPISPEMDATIAFCFEETQHLTNYSALVIKARLFETIYRMSKAQAAFPSPRMRDFPAGEDERVLKARQYILDNMDVMLTCGDVARYCNLSEKQMGRLFQRHEGMSLLQFIHRAKLAAAQKLLLDERLSLRDISESLGFQNEYYFNTFFTRGCGMTPGDYRRSCPNMMEETV